MGHTGLVFTARASGWQLLSSFFLLAMVSEAFGGYYDYGTQPGIGGKHIVSPFTMVYGFLPSRVLSCGAFFAPTSPCRSPRRATLSTTEPSQYLLQG